MHNGRGDGPSSSGSSEVGLSYNDAFPALPENVQERRPAMPGWGTARKVTSSSLTETLVIPYEERRFKGDEMRFVKDAESEKSVCLDIQRETGAQIVLTSSKDQSLTLLISGKREDVKRARNLALQRLQMQANISLEIPKEYHRFILGAKGKTKEDLEVSTATKIFVPKMDEHSNAIKIVGPKEGIDIARDKIWLIYEEQSKRASERLEVPKKFHPFICGPHNSRVDELRNRTGVQIHIPPPSVQSDEIRISGEKEAVAYAKNELLKILRDAQQYKEVTLQVPRAQHRYIQGPRNNSLYEILERTGVWIDLAAAGDESDSITLRGPGMKLGEAVQMVYAKANSLVKVEIPAASWIHKHMIGRGGEKVRDLANRFPNVHVNYTDDDKIVIEGPPGDVDSVRKLLEPEAKSLLSTLATQELTVEEKHMKHIIGKSGANVQRLKEELNVQIRSGDATKPNLLVIEGPKQNVAEAVKQLKEQIGKMDNARSKDIIIDRRFHKLIIGQKGEKIREIRELFKETNVAFPDARENSDVVTIRGPKEEVDKCYKHLEKLVKDLIASNFQLEVPVFKDTVRFIIGKNGANISKIRDETSTKIDLPGETSDSDVIVITGKKENAEKAKEMIMKIQSEIANAVEVKVNIPNKLHTHIIGAKGRTISGIIQECGNVHITIPQPGSNQDEIIIRGPKADAEKAKGLIEKLAQDRELSSYTVDIPAKQEHHKFIRSNVNRLRDRYNVRIVIPSSVQEEKDIITVIGRKEDVEKAKVEIEKTIVELQSIVEDAIDIPLKHHKAFTARRGEVIQEIEAESGARIAFPRQAGPAEANEKVTLRGSRESVENAKRMLQQTVDDWESHITITVDVEQKYHGNLMGTRGQNVNTIVNKYNVYVKFPERQQQQNGDAERSQPGQEVNGQNGEDNNQENERKNMITVTGKPEDCEAAKEALLSFIPVQEKVSVPYDLHRGLIGRGGENIRKLMNELNVNIKVPPPERQSDIIELSGPRKNVDQAREHFEKLVNDHALKSYKVEMRINPKYFFKLIGPAGSNVNKMRKEFDVDFQFPRKEDPPEEADRVILQGLEAQVHAARDKIQSTIDDLESKTVLDVYIDSQIHARIIGGKGANLRRLMDRYKVDIRFPRRDDNEPDLVTITGDEQNCLDAEAELKRLEDTYLDDIVESSALRNYHAPSRNQSDTTPSSGGSGPGFVVYNAPWQQNTPQTGDLQEFPNLAGMSSNGSLLSPSATAPANSRWGAPR